MHDPLNKLMDLNLISPYQSENTFEKQERKELIFEVLNCVQQLSSIFRITNIFHTEKGGNKNE
jgi:hypothetical protein